MRVAGILICPGNSLTSMGKTLAGNPSCPNPSRYFQVFTGKERRCLWSIYLDRLPWLNTLPPNCVTRPHTFLFKSCQNKAWGDPPNRPISSVKYAHTCVTNDPTNFIFHTVTPFLDHVQWPTCFLCEPGPVPEGLPPCPASCHGCVPRHNVYLLKFRAINFTLIFTLVLCSNPFG